MTPSSVTTARPRAATRRSATRAGGATSGGCSRRSIRASPFEEDLYEFALTRARRFADPLPSLVEQSPREHLQRWEIRDRKPLKQWSKGRVTLVGDAAHPTSPYAAYGAGMSIEDGYFLACELEQRRRPPHGRDQDGAPGLRGAP